MSLLIIIGFVTIKLTPTSRVFEIFLGYYVWLISNNCKKKRAKLVEIDKVDNKKQPSTI